MQPNPQPYGQSKRPVQVTVGAAIAVILAVLMAFVALLSLGVLGVMGPLLSSGLTVLVVFAGLLGLPVAGLMVWGAIQALNGKSSTGLIVSSLAALVLRLGGLALLSGSSIGSYFWAALGAILQCGAIVLLLQAPSREYFTGAQARSSDSRFPRPANQLSVSQPPTSPGSFGRLGGSPAQYPQAARTTENSSSTASRSISVLHFVTAGAASLAIPAMVLPWQVWTNSKVHLSGSNTAWVVAWGPLTISNIPVIAAVIGAIALVAARNRRAGWIHWTAGLLTTIGGVDRFGDMARLV